MCLTLTRVYSTLAWVCLHITCVCATLAKVCPTLETGTQVDMHRVADGRENGRHAYASVRVLDTPWQVLGHTRVILKRTQAGVEYTQASVEYTGASVRHTKTGSRSTCIESATGGKPVDMLPIVQKYRLRAPPQLSLKCVFIQ